MSNVDDLTEVEKQLLMAADVLGLGPRMSLRTANTWRVVHEVLRWRGLSVSQIDSGWRLKDCDAEHEKVYSALVRMTQPVNPDGPWRAAERPGVALFEGGGNWGVPGDPTLPPCWPHYNSCRLSAEGERLARLLLDEHPEYRRSSATEA